MAVRYTDKPDAPAGLSGAVAAEEQDAGRRATTGGDDRRARVDDLTLARLVPQLGHAFVDEAETVGAAFGELTTVRVDRQVTVERDAATAVEPVRGLTDAAEAQRFEPGDRVEREAVVHKGKVDVGGRHVRSRPQVRGLAEHLRLMGQGVLLPRD